MNYEKNNALKCFQSVSRAFPRLFLPLARPVSTVARTFPERFQKVTISGNFKFFAVKIPELRVHETALSKQGSLVPISQANCLA